MFAGLSALAMCCSKNTKKTATVWGREVGGPRYPERHTLGNEILLSAPWAFPFLKCRPINQSTSGLYEERNWSPCASGSQRALKLIDEAFLAQDTVLTFLGKALHRAALCLQPTFSAKVQGKLFLPAEICRKWECALKFVHLRFYLWCQGARRQPASSASQLCLVEPTEADLRAAGRLKNPL